MNKNQFISDGLVSLNEVIDKQKCSDLLNSVKNTRDWSENIFRSYEDVIKFPQTKKTNPGRGVSNLAENYDLSFIENNPIIVNTLNSILGSDYEIILKKFVVAVPNSWIPDWCKKDVNKMIAANLGPLIKKEYRDVSYFRGIDYHMDLIDHPDTVGDYVTLYIYLNDIEENMSPLNVLLGSHVFGANKFPHKLKQLNSNEIEYSRDSNVSSVFKSKTLTGSAGSAYIWTSMTLHGTKPASTNDLSRISLRYTIKKTVQDVSLIDKIIDKLNGPKTMSEVRDDFEDEETLKQVKFNKILQK